MAEPKFIDNSGTDVEKSVVYPAQLATVATLSEEAKVTVHLKHAIWKRVLFIALIFLSGFGTSSAFHMLHRHSHRGDKPRGNNSNHHNGKGSNNKNDRHSMDEAP